jgi:hypothetical protein
MSPVEIWGMPYFWQMKVAWVPLPAPGAPNRISLMTVLFVKVMKCATACTFAPAAAQVPARVLSPREAGLLWITAMHPHGAPRANRFRIAR